MTDINGPARTLPVLEEALRIDRQRVETGAVRVRVDTTESRQPLRLDSWTEHVDVERVPVERAVAERREPWRDGDVLIVPVYEERVVVQRTLVLKEELRLRVRREHSTEETEAVLRRDEVHVERRDANGEWTDIDDDALRASPAAFPEVPKESR